MRLGTFVGADVRVHGFTHDRVRKLEAFGGLEDHKRDQQIGRARRLILGDLGQ